MKPNSPLQGWYEVPHWIYAAWHPAKQMEYCIQRDLYAAEYAIQDDYCPGLGKKWFLDRAAGYKEELNKLLKKAV